MANWNMGSPEVNGVREMMIDIAHDDSTGAMEGKITLRDTTYSVTGNWAASGSIAGRNYSAFELIGQNASPDPTFIAAAGTMKGPGASPQSVEINANTASSANGIEFGYSGELFPI